MQHPVKLIVVLLLFATFNSQVNRQMRTLWCSYYLLFTRPRGHNHVFKVGGPVPSSRVLLPFNRKKLDRSTQFGVVGHIITLYSSKGYVKSSGVRPNFGRRTPRPPPPSGAPMTRPYICLVTDGTLHLFVISYNRCHQYPDFSSKCTTMHLAA